MREDWIECTLGEILTIERGGSPRPIKEFLTNDDNGVNWIKIGDVTNSGKYILETVQKIKPSGITKSREVFPGDLLLSNSMSFGRPYIMGIKGAIHDGWLVIRDNKYLDKDFLYYALGSPTTYNQFSKKAKGSTVKNLNIGLVSNVNIKLVSLPIQKAIVKKIEELFSSLDSGITDLKKAQDQLVIYRQAVLKKAFEGEHELIKLEAISEAVGGNAFKSKTFLKEKGKYQIIRIGNVRPGIIRYDASPVFINEVEEKVLEKYLLKEGDVIITLTGTRKKRDYGFTTVVKTNNLLLNQRLAYLRFNESYLPQFFLYYSWSEPFKIQFFGSETGNVGQGNVGMKSVRQTLVPKLSLKEQHQIVQEIESRLSVCDTVEKDIALAIERSRNLRQSILKKAFEGKLLSEEEIAKCKEDASYEPASVLLERIKKEKLKKS